MATAAQSKRTPTQGAEVRETVDSLFDESVATAREYATVASASMLGGIKAAFAIQEVGLAASREVLTASIDGTKSLIDAWADTLRTGQAAATRLATSGAKLVEDSLPTR